MTPAAVRAMFRRLRARFAERYPSVAAVRLHLVDRVCPSGSACAARDLAWYHRDVYLLVRALRLSRNKVGALLAHELSHAADRRRWQAGSEQRADDIAESVLGRRIRYARDGVQTFGRGQYPRPKHLHS